MDVFRRIECYELLIAIGYSLYALMKRKPDHVTGCTFFGMALTLSVDIFWLHGHKPLWGWFVLNIPFLVYIYEKICRKYCVRVFRKLVVSLLMFFD